MVFTDFAEAKKAAEAAGLVVLGFYKGDVPSYTLADPNTDELGARNQVFELRHNRPLSPQEDALQAYVDARAAAPSA